MALLTFMDSNGERWRVWNVSRDTLIQTRNDSLGREYRGGWLVFQREGTDDRRRLANFPEDWAQLQPDQLERLCSVARPVTTVRLGGPLMEITREGPRYEG